MAIVRMTEQRSSVGAEKDQKSWFYQEVLSSPGNGAWILKPNGTIGMGMTIIPSSGSGKIQATTDSHDDINADIATATDWPYGQVSGTTQASCVEVSAVRQVNISGTTTIKVVAD